ncbi:MULTISPECIES: hypothetical protein [Gimesia]|uniref:Uncharacterized protein n=1 Tax=Gimesia chilikensis TaxID=2605989 RepID=A0A517PWU7_9PLAN|nr:hypothetical protein [Gimesia chilikensis]QDT23856.1 hypothetical protein HG66A1_56810 [Gimesia chilikensis]
MTESSFTDQELLSYLDESLSTDLMSQIEAALRQSDRLRVRLAELARQRDEGVHSVGEIWRRNRLSCPTRSQLGGYLLETLPAEFQSFVEFHLQQTGCRYCNANLEDLKAGLSNLSADSQRRREKYFQSSAGYFSSQQDDE